MASLHFARNQANDVSSLTWGTIRSSGVGCVAAAVVVQQPRMCDCKRSFGRAQRGSGEVVAGASHVPGVAEVLAALSGALVGAHLEVDDALASAQLLLRPFALLFLGGLGSQAGSVVLGVSVAGTADGHQALGDLGNVPLLPQVDGLEDVNLGHAPGLGSVLEVRDVLHELELAAAGVDLGDATGHQLVHQVAEDGAVAENVSEVTVGEGLSKNGAHPLLDALLQGRVALAGNLRQTITGQWSLADPSS